MYSSFPPTSWPAAMVEIHRLRTLVTTESPQVELMAALLDVADQAEATVFKRCCTFCRLHEINPPCPRR